MRARLRSARVGVVSAETWVPTEAASWETPVSLDLVCDADGEPLTPGFTITVCDQRWIADSARMNGPLVGGRRLVVDRWEARTFAAWCKDVIEAVEAPTKEELTTLLRRRLTPADPLARREFVGDCREELLSVHCADVRDLETWRPADPRHFSLAVQYIVGPVGQIGEDWFELTLCSSAWVAQQVVNAPNGFDARYHLIVDHWNWSEIEHAIQAAIASPTDAVSPHARGDLGRWEDEDYDEDQVPLIVGNPFSDDREVWPFFRFMCPVCGYPDLVEPPRIGTGGGSYAYCPSCDFQFGVTDDDEGFTYESWRERWIARGMPWAAGDDVQGPTNWDPAAQLRNVED